MKFDSFKGIVGGERLGVHYQFLVAAFVVSVVLFNREAGIALAIPKVASLVLIFVFFVQLIGNRRPLHVPMTYRIWALWFFVAAASMLLADDFRPQRIITLTQLSIVSFVVTNLLIWNRDVRFYMWVLLIAAIASSLWILSNPAEFTARTSGRLAGTIGNPNAHGVLLSVAMVLALSFSLATKRRLVKLGLVLLTVWFAFQILETGSRQSILGGIVVGGGAVVLADFYRRWHAADGSFAKAVLVYLVALAVLVPFVLGSDYWFRVENAMAVFQGDMDADGSTSDRLWRIQRGLEIWAGNPVIGIGLANYASIPQADHFFAGAIGGYSHNNYIEILVGTGLIGFLLYLSIYVFWALKLFTLRYALRDEETFAPYVVILSTVLITIVTDLTRASYHEKLFWLLFPLIAAGLYLLEAKRLRVVVGGHARDRVAKGSQNGRENAATSFSLREL